MGTFFALNALTALVGPMIAAAEAGTLSSPGPYRPREWTGSALTAITIPGQVPLGKTQPSPSIVYVFDAVFKVEHSRELRRTEHPIQTSAGSAAISITDHAYLLPSRVELEIGMSDAMDSYSRNEWGSTASKSISAYQTLVNLMQSRLLVTLTTRLATYKNMLIEAVTSADTHQTRHGLRATVVLSEVFLADATAVASVLRPTLASDDTAGGVSARPQATDATPAGTQQTTPVPAALTAQHNLTSSASPIPAFPTVPGAGNWSSGNLSSIGNVLA